MILTLLAFACSGAPPPAATPRCDLLEPADIEAACGIPFQDAPSPDPGRSICLRFFQAPASDASAAPSEVSLDVRSWHEAGFGPQFDDVRVMETRPLSVGDQARVQRWKLGSQPETVSGTLLQDGLRVVVAADASDCAMDGVEALVRKAAERLKRR